MASFNNNLMQKLLLRSSFKSVTILPSNSIDQQVVVFVTIISAVLILSISVFVFNFINPVLAGLVLLVIGIIAFFSPKVVEFKEYERGVLFRTGRLQGVVGPGWVWIYPYLDKYERVDLRLQDYDVAPQKVISKDGVAMTVDASINYKVKDPATYVLASRNITLMLGSRAVSALREAASTIDYLDAITGNEVFDNALMAAVVEISAGLGIEIVTAEVQHIILPAELLEAMREKETAIQKKDAIETEASIKTVYLEKLDAAASKLSPATLNYLYLDSIRRMPLSKGDKIVVPYDLEKLLALFTKS